LKDVLTYGGGTIFGYSGFIAFIYQFTKDLNLIIIYILLLTLFLWMAFIQIKIKRRKINNKKKKEGNKR